MKSQDYSDKQQATRERIMNAATQLFTEKGYAGTTTRAIALLAGVNEVTLFRQFGTKEKLAKAIMDQYGGMAIAAELEQHFSGDYVHDLTLVGQVLMEVMAERRDAIRMAICEAGNFPEFQQVVAENPRQLRRVLARYLEGKMKSGLIHPGHADLLAQAYLGMFFSYSVLRGFLRDALQPELSSDEILEQFVALFVRGTLVK